MNKRENEIYADIHRNKGMISIDTYLQIHNLLIDDEEKIEKAKKLLEGQLKKIQSIFGRLSPECDLSQQDMESWIKYIYGLGE